MIERPVCFLVVSDPEILGGDPVFRGTRVPVHLIATLLARGCTEADILKGYPRVTPEMFRLAPAFAQAYPIRGRPRLQPWRDRPPQCSVFVSRFRNMSDTTDKSSLQQPPLKRGIPRRRRALGEFLGRHACDRFVQD
jgi:uncharacterized protein (DUF433 family)